jgi:hypothetical protein
MSIADIAGEAQAGNPDAFEELVSLANRAEAQLAVLREALESEHRSRIDNPCVICAALADTADSERWLSDIRGRAVEEERERVRPMLERLIANPAILHISGCNGIGWIERADDTCDCHPLRHCDPDQKIAGRESFWHTLPENRHFFKKRDAFVSALLSSDANGSHEENS